jgi:teichuronic acid exporter
MSQGLRKRAVSAISWSFVETIGQRIIQLVIGIVLARLLLPEEFGLIAMLVVFTAVSQSFLDSGFGSALIQKQNDTHLDRCSIFYFNILVGLLAAGALCLAAPAIAAFYGEPSLTPLTRVLSLGIVVNSFGLIQLTDMVKRMDFRSLAKANTAAVAISGVAGIALAYTGFGVWALAIQQLVANSLRTALMWSFSSWRPTFEFSWGALRCMFPFGSRMLASGLIDKLFRNVYLIVIGKLFSAADLGFYSRALLLQEAPTQSISAVVSRVTFSMFSAISTDSQKLRRAVRKALEMLTMVNFPLLIGLATCARPVILVLFGVKWEPAIPYLQLLCFVGLTFPLHTINLNVLKARGRSDLFLRLEIVKKTITVINVAVMWRWGIESLIVGQIVVSLVSFYLNSYYTGVFLAYPMHRQVCDVLPYGIVTAIMASAVLALSLVPFESQALLLVCQVFVGGSVYIALCALFRLSAFMEVVEIVRNRFCAPRTP